MLNFSRININICVVKYNLYMYVRISVFRGLSERIDFMSMKFTALLKTEAGVISITEEDGKISGIETGAPIVSFFMAETPLLKEAKKQLSEYFAGKRKSFDLPLKLEGTDFQLSVWNVLKDIPYGETRTYKQTAEMAGCPGSYRAVGTANGKNPIPIIIPCHRVVASDGSLSGYALGTEFKKYLLELEAKNA